MKNIAIFASGSGSNFQAIVEAVEAGLIHANVKLLVCDKPGAFVIERAKQYGIPQYIFAAKDFPDKHAYEQEILKALKGNDVDYIILAGYMRLIGMTLLSTYSDRIVNIHPSLLPAYPGKDAIGQALAAKARQTGVTIHLVDEGMDTGPIIAQQTIEVADNDTKESLQEKIHKVEHQFYPKVLQKILT
jgi:formyltetrahydrofolate-dependent phosphoribosylglycinamide formyltransferase